MLLQCATEGRDAMTKLPELEEKVIKTGDDDPRQSDFIDWLESFISAPPLGREETKLPELSEHVIKEGDVTAGDDSPRQSDVLDWVAQLLSAPLLGDAK
jgi:hypothetical protein